MRASGRGLAVSFLLALVLPGTALAQEKSLHWSAKRSASTIKAAGSIPRHIGLGDPISWQPDGRGLTSLVRWRS